MAYIRPGSSSANATWQGAPSYAPPAGDAANAGWYIPPPPGVTGSGYAALQLSAIAHGTHLSPTYPPDRMEVIKPILITDGALISSSIAEADHPEWSAGTNYALGDLVIRAATHRVYESLTASNTGHTPESSPVQWLDTGPTNRWAMFDQKIGTASTATGTMTIVLEPGQVNSLALLEISGSELQIQMTSSSEGGDIVYSQTIALDATTVLDYYDYFFADFEQRTSVILMDLPPYTDGRITVTLTGAGEVAIGVLVTGKYTYLGSAEYGATAGITSYSLKTTDAFGNTTVTRRPNAKRPTFKLLLDKAAINRVHRRLSELDSTLCVWVGVADEDYSEALNAYGFFKGFSLDVAYPVHSYYSIEIEGTT